MFDDALPDKIYNIGDFISAVFATLIALLVLSIALMLIIGDFSAIVAPIIIFVFLLNAKDYGFFTASFIMIFTYILAFIIGAIKRMIFG